jgi:hypothetical protein
MQVRLSRRVVCQVDGSAVYTRALFRRVGTSRWSGGRLVGCDGTDPAV